jgi:hypothetical protein
MDVLKITADVHAVTELLETREVTPDDAIMVLAWTLGAMLALTGGDTDAALDTVAQGFINTTDNRC